MTLSLRSRSAGGTAWRYVRSLKQRACERPLLHGGPKRASAALTLRRAMASSPSSSSSSKAALKSPKAASSAAQRAGASEEELSKVYCRLTPIEHVLLRPEVYLGAVQPITRVVWIPQRVAGGDWRILPRNVRVVPGLVKIFDEIIVNAADNHQRDRSTTEIDVSVNQAKGTVRVSNNGSAPPIVPHRTEKVHIPEMIFGTLLTGSNFGDTSYAERLTAGRHGYGAKLTNIMSSRFDVLIRDAPRKLEYTQKWTHNMRKMQPPVLGPFKAANGESFTSISFTPDLARFGLAELDDDSVAIMRKRVWDVAACLADSGVRVSWNGERLPVHNFRQYAALHGEAGTVGVEEAAMEAERGASEFEGEALDGAGASAEAASATLNAGGIVFGGDGRFEYGVRLLKASERQLGVPSVSFVNSVATYRGGTHVQHVLDSLYRHLSAQLSPHKVPPSLLRNNVLVFVRAIVDKPSFESQSKEMLTTRYEDLKRYVRVSEDFLHRAGEEGQLKEMVQQTMNSALWRDLQRTTRTVPRKSIHNTVPKLEDAYFAGKSTQAGKCTLILTEGDSAKALAMAGLSVVGRDYYGVFPLRGKLLNVRDCSYSSIIKNQEIAAVLRILGLKYGQDYSTSEARAKLRYGRLMLMTDQDHDGHHIKALLINALDYFWPSLLRTDGFLETFVTPIVKVRARFIPGGVEAFYDQQEYRRWFDALTAEQRAATQVKYYKGLGTSTREEAREYFNDIGRHRLRFTWDRDSSDLIDMAFKRVRAEERRAWLEERASEAAQIKRADLAAAAAAAESRGGSGAAAVAAGNADEESLDTVLPVHAQTDGFIPYADFFNLQLREYGLANVLRSIPSALDGLKPSQRKILYAAFKKRLVSSEMKVSQLAGYVAEQTAYHHGELSIQNAIVRMAQNFVGSNNLPLLMPLGQFGTRLQGGEDAASARYLYTKLSPLARLVYPEADDHLLPPQEEDGVRVEPQHYAPVIPMALVNGINGIGSGYATSIPAHNPLELIRGVEAVLDGDSAPPLRPWTRGFHGDVVEEQPGVFCSLGRVRLLRRDRVRVSELPVGMWTEQYKATLLRLEQSGRVVSGFDERFTDSLVEFDLTLSSRLRRQLRTKPLEDFRRVLGLQKRISSYINLLDENGRICHFADAAAVLEHFVRVRLPLYERRRELLLSRSVEQRELLEERSRFIALVTDGALKVHGVSLESVIAALRRRHFTPRRVEDGGGGGGGGGAGTAALGGFAHLLSTPLVQMTSERAHDLARQATQARERERGIEMTSASELYRQDLTALREAVEKHSQPGGVLYLASTRQDDDAAMAKSRRRRSRASTTLAARSDRHPQEAKTPTDRGEGTATTTTTEKAATSAPADVVIDVDLADAERRQHA